jgi:uncharacterized protein
MLEMRPSCENCDKQLPNESADAMICTHECTFCEACVKNVLKNVCPNCGGGFEKRPTRPVNCLTPNCVTNYPVSTVRKYRPVNWEKYKLIQETFIKTDPRER